MCGCVAWLPLAARRASAAAAPAPTPLAPHAALLPALQCPSLPGLKEGENEAEWLVDLTTQVRSILLPGMCFHLIGWRDLLEMARFFGPLLSGACWLPV